MKLTPADVLAIRHCYDRRSERRVTQRELAALYGVDWSTVNQIVLGRSRKNLGGPRTTASNDAATRAVMEFNGGAKLNKRQRELLQELEGTIRVENKPERRTLLGKVKDIFG